MLLLIPAVILLVIAGLLMVSFHVSLNLRKEGFCVFGFYKVTFLGFVISKGELPSPKRSKDEMEADLRKETGLWRRFPHSFHRRIGIRHDRQKKY